MIQKLYGSFKGDAFDKRVLPFFHECNDVYLGVLLTRLRGMPWNASAVELRFEEPYKTLPCGECQVLSTMSLSRAVSMRKNGKSQLA